MNGSTTEENHPLLQRGYLSVHPLRRGKGLISAPSLRCQILDSSLKGNYNCCKFKGAKACYVMPREQHFNSPLPGLTILAKFLMRLGMEGRHNCIQFVPAASIQNSLFKDFVLLFPHENNEVQRGPVTGKVGIRNKSPSPR